MKAGIPHSEVAQFITEGSRFGHRRVVERDGARYVVVPADLPDGSRLELWVQPEALPYLVAALMGRPTVSPELGAPQPTVIRGELVRKALRPGDAVSLRAAEVRRGLDVLSPGDAVADAPGTGGAA